MLFFQGGDRIYNTLEMWKNAASCYDNTNNEVSGGPQPEMASLGPTSGVGVVPPSTYQPLIDREEFDVDYVLQMCENYPPPPPEYAEVTRSRVAATCAAPGPAPSASPAQAPPSFEAHMATANAVAGPNAGPSSLDKPMPPIEDLLSSEPPQVQQVAPPPPYPGSSSLTTLIQPPSSQHSSTHDLTEGMYAIVKY